MAALWIAQLDDQAASGQPAHVTSGLRSGSAEPRLTLRGIDDGSTPMSICASDGESTGWIVMDRTRIVSIAGGDVPTITDSLLHGISEPIGLLPLGDDRYVVYGPYQMQVVSLNGGRLEQTASTDLAGVTQGLRVVHASALMRNRVLLAACCGAGSGTSRYTIAEIQGDGRPRLVRQLSSSGQSARVGGKDSVFGVAEVLTDAASVMFFRLTEAGFRLVAQWPHEFDQLAVLAMAAPASDAFTVLIRRKDVDAPSRRVYELLRLTLDVQRGIAREMDRTALPAALTPNDVDCEDSTVSVIGSWAHGPSGTYAASAVVIYSDEGGSGLRPDDTLFSPVNAGAVTTDAPGPGVGAIALGPSAVAWIDREGVERVSLGDSDSTGLRGRHRLVLRDVGRDGCAQSDTIVVATAATLVRVTLDDDGGERRRETAHGGGDHIACTDSRHLLVADSTLRAIDWPDQSPPEVRWSVLLRRSPLITLCASDTIVALNHGINGVEVATLSTTGPTRRRHFAVDAHSLQALPWGILFLDMSGRLFRIRLRSDEWQVDEVMLPPVGETPTAIAARDSTIYLLCLGMVYRLRDSKSGPYVLDSVRIGGSAPLTAEVSDGVLYAGDAHGYSQIIWIRDGVTGAVQRWSADHDAARMTSFTRSGIAFAGGQRGLSHWRFGASSGSATDSRLRPVKSVRVTARRSTDGTVTVALSTGVEERAQVVLVDVIGRRLESVSVSAKSTFATFRSQWPGLYGAWLMAIVVSARGALIGSAVVE